MRRASRRVLGMVVLASGLFAACGGAEPVFQPMGFVDGGTVLDGAGGDGSVGPNGPRKPGTLRLVPENASVTVQGGVPATLDYQAFLVNDDGTETDVTAEATFSVIIRELGSFSGPRFTSGTTRGGTTRVRAEARNRVGETELTVRLETAIVEKGAPPDAASRFGGPADASRAPELVYPPSGVLVPPNLNVLELHFLPGAGNTLFEIVFLGEATQLTIYTPCVPVGEGCVYALGEKAWEALAGAERGKKPVRYRVRGVNGTSPAGVGASAEQTISFGEADINGGLYYWNAGAGAIRRYDFGLRGQTAENFMDQGRAGASMCVGCHVLSRDGKKVAVGLDIPSPSVLKVFDVATRTPVFSMGSVFGGGGANFYAFSPDASQLLTSSGVSIVLRDATTGEGLVDPLVEGGAMPDWSPDGSTIVYARAQSAIPCFDGFPCGTTGVDKASLALLTFDGADWSDGGTLVPYAGKNNYYPTFSPDGTWVLFNQSPGDNNSYDAPDAQVWVVQSTPGATPVHLGTASTGGDSWPKWAPDVQPYRGGKLLWFTFSSRRGYGLRSGDGELAQIWMAAFDPARAAAGEDGSYPAFWLPFQEPDSGNHIAQWVTRVERQSCETADVCSPGEICQGRVCVPPPPMPRG